MVAYGSTLGSLGRDISRLEWRGQKGAPTRARVIVLGSGCAPPPPKEPYLKQVRSQLLGDAVQGPRAAWLSPRVS